MIRGTTPTHTFHTDIDLSGATSVFVTYKQGTTVNINKAKANLTITSSTVVAALSQAETLQLSAGTDVQIQIRAKLSDGTAVASNIMSVPVEAILKDGEI